MEGQLAAMQSAVDSMQGYIEQTVARLEQLENLASSGMPFPEKEIFLVEEGTVIPTAFKEEMMGGEVFLLPDGYLNIAEFEIPSFLL